MRRRQRSDSARIGTGELRTLWKGALKESGSRRRNALDNRGSCAMLGNRLSIIVNQPGDSPVGRRQNGPTLCSTRHGQAVKGGK